MIDVDVAVVPALARRRAAIAVVIDVLRATSTIVTALGNGANDVVPVREPDDAIGVMKRLGRDRVLLCGERNARVIVGFDLDNSPASYRPEIVAGKTLAFTTTNGTRALVEAASGTANVFCGALINRAAIVDAIAAAGIDDVLLVCAGDDGQMSLEDLLCAGAIVAGLAALGPIRRTDAATVAATVFDTSAKRITTAIATGTHARTLRDAGFADDIAACARLDVSSVVPAYRDGRITAA